MRIESPTTSPSCSTTSPTNVPVARLGAAAHHLAHLGLVHRAGEQQAGVGPRRPTRSTKASPSRGSKGRSSSRSVRSGQTGGTGVRNSARGASTHRSRDVGPPNRSRSYAVIGSRIASRPGTASTPSTAWPSRPRPIGSCGSSRSSVDRGRRLGDALGLLPDPHRRDLAQADVLPGQVGPPLLLADARARPPRTRRTSRAAGRPRRRPRPARRARRAPSACRRRGRTTAAGGGRPASAPSPRAWPRRSARGRRRRPRRSSGGRR